MRRAAVHASIIQAGTIAKQRVVFAKLFLSALRGFKLVNTGFSQNSVRLVLGLAGRIYGDGSIVSNSTDPRMSSIYHAISDEIASS